MRSKLLALSAAGVVALALAACGEDAEDGGDSGGDGPTVAIVQPADGDALSVPFTFEVDSSEALGPTDTGDHHVHLYVDGDDSVYEVIESANGEEVEISADSPILEGLEDGEHTLNVSLRNADHSAAGAEDEITVTLGGAGSGDADDSEDSEDSGDTDYGY